METKTGRKIVSKGKYAVLLSERTTLKAIGVSSGFFTLLFAFLAIVSVIFAIGVTFFALTIMPHLVSLCVSLWAAGLALSAMSGLCGYAGLKTWKQSQRIDPGVPLTRANTADLPAPDSLVRASAEPMQAQEAILLRAAAQGVETPPEQLVRAFVGEEESR